MAQSADDVALVNPNLMLQSHDLFTTGIVYMPVSLAYLAGALRGAGIRLNVDDAFGEAPNDWWKADDFVFRGLTPQAVVARLESNPRVVILYAINLTYHRSLISILQAVRGQLPQTRIVILENSQAVTAYSVRKVQESFYDAGADFVVAGEGEERGLELIRELLKDGPADLERIAKIDGIGFRQAGRTHFTAPERKIQNLDALPFAAWDLFPLQNYWRLGYSHGPLGARRYLPLLTSRGCPYACRFCVIPDTNDLKWRGRSARNVVDEIAEHQKLYGVNEFHIEDVDPTVNDVRTREICDEILKRGLKVTWKICSGTKVETIRSESTLEKMYQAGCRYISVSPESGSPRVMKLINKPFKIEHAVQLIRKMSRLGIRSQACFVLGFPGEEDSDRELTWKMARDLTREGLDEIALFVITPVPGSAIFDGFAGYTDYSQLHFSPTWREDYQRLNAFRIRLYRQFLFWKIRYYPMKVVKQCLNFLIRRFETKMEMAPYRALHTFLMLKGLWGRQVQ